VKTLLLERDQRPAVLGGVRQQIPHGRWVTSELKTQG
jgi:hypothetical protein